ncbi:hypothetical protein PR202_ga15731 [Eleusine coracana subsp. coracana]|uniref:Exocyst subunit Exo70 family protein n=1 Tax=Eleusine coracana subsp. coracana TaxID=191504 RepID=A0AAV5CKF5_ELECO|nr:hypothetical protein PR202_ga15731 [Eleusine coracana subsp. coracana]
MNYLRDEGLRVTSGFSSGVSKLVLRERFKGFSALFGEAHKVQSGWYVPDTRLREELRISVSERLLLAYRPFLAIRSGHHRRPPELRLVVAELTPVSHPSSFHASHVPRSSLVVTLAMLPLPPPLLAVVLAPPRTAERRRRARVRLGRAGHWAVMAYGPSLALGPRLALERPARAFGRWAA